MNDWSCPNCYQVNERNFNSCKKCGCYPATYKNRDDLYGPKVGKTPWYVKVTDLFTKKD